MLVETKVFNLADMDRTGCNVSSKGNPLPPLSWITEDAASLLITSTVTEETPVPAGIEVVKL